jgi:hypothetical protein
MVDAIDGGKTAAARPAGAIRHDGAAKGLVDLQHVRKWSRQRDPGRDARPRKTWPGRTDRDGLASWLAAAAAGAVIRVLHKGLRPFT